MRHILTLGTGTSTAGTVGWAYTYPLATRRELFLMLDNGWQQGDEAASRDLVLNAERFPELMATSRLRAILIWRPTLASPGPAAPAPHVHNVISSISP